MGCTFSVFTTSINMHIVEYINQWQFERNQNSLSIWNIDCTSSGGLETVSFIWYTWWRHQMETFYALLAMCVCVCVCVGGGGGGGGSPVNSPHKGRWRGAEIFSLICASLNGWVDNREDCDLRRHRAHYNIIVISYRFSMALRPLLSVLYIYSFRTGPLLNPTHVNIIDRIKRNS